MDKSPKYYVKRKNPKTEEFILWLHFAKFKNKQNNTIRITRWRLTGRGLKRTFWGDRNVLDLVWDGMGVYVNNSLNCKLKICAENSLAIQWLGLCASTARGPDLILGWGTKIPQTAHCGQKNPKNKQTNKNPVHFTVCKFYLNEEKTDCRLI